MKIETLEEAAERLYPRQPADAYYGNVELLEQEAFENGAKWQQERSYSEEEVENLIQNIINEIEIRKQNIISNSKKMNIHLLEGGCLAFESSQDVVKEWFEQFKKKQL